MINLRGRVIPIIDLRLKFEMEFRKYDKETCIIVVNRGDSFVGIAVDTVSEVLDITAKEVEPPPNFGAGVKSNVIKGIGKVSGKVKLLLDVEMILSGSQLDEVASLEAEEIDNTEKEGEE